MGLLLCLAKLLNVNGLYHLLAVGYRGLFEGLTAAELFDDAGSFEFTFEFLKSFLDVLALFYLYDNSFLDFIILLVTNHLYFAQVRQGIKKAPSHSLCGLQS